MFNLYYSTRHVNGPNSRSSIKQEIELYRISTMYNPTIIVAYIKLALAIFVLQNKVVYPYENHELTLTFDLSINLGPGHVPGIVEYFLDKQYFQQNIPNISAYASQ